MTSIRNRFLRRQGRRLLASAAGVPISLLGLLAAPTSSRREHFRPSQVERILLIRFDLLGDVVLTIPAVRAIRQTYPKARIDWLVLPYTAPIAQTCSYVDEVLTFDVQKLRPSGELTNPRHLLEFFRLTRRLRQHQYDLAVSFHGYWASAVSLLSGARWRLGYAGESYPYSLNLTLPGKRYRIRKHEAEYCLDLARAAGAVVTDDRTKLSVTPKARVHAVALFEREGVSPDDRVVGIHMGASNGTAKRWTPEGWAAVADRLLESGVKVVFTGAPSEAGLIANVVGRMRGTPVVVAGKTGIGDLAAVIDRCDAFLSGDSGPMHMAIALGKPVVAIHGPSDPRLSGPFHGDAIVVRLDLPCSPCYDLTDSAECPLGHHRCMRDLGPDRVWRAVERQLERAQSVKSSISSADRA